jgi:hypothetical protein
MKYVSYFSWPVLCASSLSVTACLTPDFDFGARGGVSVSADASSQGDTTAGGNGADDEDSDGASDSGSQGSSSVDNNSSGDSSSGDSSSGDSSSGDSSSGDSNGSDPVDPVDPTPHCLNREVDKDETDTDCGGLDCGGCRDGQTCSIDSDCESSACDDDKTCITPTCFDSKSNGDESGIDCGGSCSDKCNTDEGCFGDSDCESAVCEDRVCAAPACDDGVLNGDETDVDCGGADCAACEYGAACSDDADCSVESNSSGTAVCSGLGACSITCNSGSADCNADGICEDTASDPNRCGGCLPGDPVPGSGSVCGASAENTTAACANSSCSLACVPGYTDNDSNLSDGCENRIADCKEQWVRGTSYSYTGTKSEVSNLGQNWRCQKAFCSTCVPEPGNNCQAIEQWSSLGACFNH